VLALSDEDGNLRAAIGVSPNGPMMAMADENGAARVAIGATPNITFDLEDITFNPESSLILYDADMDVIWQAPPK